MNQNFFNTIFGKVAPGMCRISIDGKIAIKTSNGYKSYNVNTGRLTNCDHFALDIGEDFFFIIPTNRVEKGDIILAGGKPRCVIDVGKNEIKTFCYEDSSIDTIVPEHHMFMGKQYFYGKIISMFGNIANGEKGMGNMMKYMMMSAMMNGNSSSFGNNSNGGSMLPMLLMMNNDNDFFGNLFDISDDDDAGKEEEE